MKKILLTLCAIFAISAIASAQTKTAYCDVYARGGGQNLKVTVLFGGQPYLLGKGIDLGTALNTLSNDGWVIEESLVIPRHALFSLFTRHKVHIIMKKEYRDGENPCANLVKMKKSAKKGGKKK